MGMSSAKPPRLPRGDVEPSVAREAGEKMVSLLGAAFEQTLTQTADLNKWILAALVTLNGGAILGLGKIADRMEAVPLSHAIEAFAAGCVLAVLAGLTGAISAIATSKPLGELLGYWLKVRSTGEYADDENSRLARNLSKRGLLTYGFAVLVGFGSLLCFGLGSLVIAHQTALHDGSALAAYQSPSAVGSATR